MGTCCSNGNANGEKPASSAIASGSNGANDDEKGSQDLLIAVKKSGDPLVDMALSRVNTFAVADEDNDPSNIILALSGVWTGASGTDTLFAGVPGVQPQGFTTPFSEIVRFYAINGSILNPSQFSSSLPGGSEGEILYGVHYFRDVFSTLQPNTDGNNPFTAPKEIHQETGYILFCYTGVPGDKSQQTLTRVVKSLAIPRAQTILAHDESPVIHTDPNGNGVIGYNLDANQASAENLIWVVGNGQFTSKNAIVTQFVQTCRLTIVNSSSNFIGSTFYYDQKTPIQFLTKPGAPISPHSNTNTLTKRYTNQ